MSVDVEDLRSAIRDLGLTGRPLCVHSSLRSFGTVTGGAPAVVESCLAERCTLLVPTFSWDAFAVPPPPDPAFRPARNGSDYDQPISNVAAVSGIYTPDARAIDAEMGAIPAAVLARPDRVRGDHPLCSFTAVGSQAAMLISGQRPLDVFAPLLRLADTGGYVVCMGAGLTRMTLIHLAEVRAARRPFRRWANGTHGRPMQVEVGGCSEGFENLARILAPLERQARVGDSVWRVFPAREALDAATAAIRREPAITHCGVAMCIRCNDAVLGGPIVDI